MNRLKLTLACLEYDRTRALIDGRVRPDGIDLICLPMRAEEIFYRMVEFREFHVSEMSFSTYVIHRAGGGKDFMAIPVFLSRMFRHSSIYIRDGGSVKYPEDLKGKRVGVPEYQVTSAVWARGLLHHEYGVSADQIEWVTGGLEEPGRHEKISISLPSSIRVTPAPSGKILREMLEHGEIDALLSPRPPTTFRSGRGKIKRLFEDYGKMEIEFYRKTGFFPIMHTVVIRSDILESYPWVAQNLFKAFSAAKELGLDLLDDASALRATLPFLVYHLEETRRIMGEDFWPYGLEKNRKEIETFLQYCHEQGLIRRKLEPEELFVRNTLSSYKV